MTFFYLKLAMKNLWRHRRRTLLTFFAISVGLMTFIVFDSLLLGADQQSIDNLINFDTAHLRIHHPDYWEKREEQPLDLLISSPEAIRDLIHDNPGVVASTSRLVFSALLNTGWEESPVMAIGMDEYHEQVFDHAESTFGRMPQQGNYEAGIGYRLAELLDIGIGDFVTLITRTPQGSFQAIDLEIVGLINSTHPNVNRDHIYFPLDVASQALNVGQNVSEISIRYNRQQNLTGVAQDLEQQIQAQGLQANVYTWENIAAEFLTIGETKRAFNAISLAMVLVIAVVGVVNTILLATLERTREIGTLKALGMGRKQIIRLFMTEALGIGVIGSLLGCLFGILANYFMIHVGIDFGTLLGDVDMGYPIAGAMRGTWNWNTIFLAFPFGVITSWLASYWPARRAASLDPIQALYSR